MPIDHRAAASNLSGVLRLTGSPYEIGLQHGRARTEEIGRIINQLPQLPDSSTDDYFGPAEIEELHGIAEGAAIDVTSLVALNMLLNEDAGGGSIHFALSSEANGKYDLLHGVNEDGHFAQSHCSVCQRILFAVSPDAGIPHVTFGVAGLIGGLNGINARGLAVSTTSLIDVDGRPASKNGRLHSVLVKNLLEQATDIDHAVEIVKRDPGCTAFTLCISHAAEDRLCYIEYDNHLMKAQPWVPDVISANHRLMQTIPSEAPPASARRMNRLRQLLGGDPPDPLAPLDAMVALRDRSDSPQNNEPTEPTNDTICRGDNQASILFHPTVGSVWVSSDVESADIKDVYSHYDLRELLPDYIAAAPNDSPAVDLTNTGWSTAPEAVDLPLIDAVPEHQPGKQLLAESHLNPTSDVFLVQHQFKARPLMPLVCMVESLLEAAALLAPDGQRVVGISDVNIQNGLPFQTDDVQTGRIRAATSGADIECQLTCDMRNRSGRILLKDKPHLSGRVQLAAVGNELPEVAPSVTARPELATTEWVRCFYTEDIVIYHGPVFRCLRELAVEGDTAWGHIFPFPTCRFNGPRTGNRWLTNPTLLDACLYACGSFLWLKHRGTIAIPDGIDQLRIGRMPCPREKCLFSMADRGRREDRTYYDFSVFGDNGDLLIDVQGYSSKIVAEEPPPPE